MLGRGGAGFPAAIKLRAVASARRGKRVVVVNAAEGEPASSKDVALLSGAPHLVLDGAALAAAVVGADEVIVAVKRTAVAAIGAVDVAIAERAAGDQVRWSVVEAPAAYVAGEESALINYLNTGRALPTFVPPRPFERGVDGRPTLVQNVETLANLALIARRGPDWFREVGTLEDPGSHLITISGAVNSPGVYEVPGGIPFPGLIERCGGASESIQAFLIGGYAGIWLSTTRAASLRLGHAPLLERGAGLGPGIVVALPAAACGVCEAARVTRYLAEESAGQCGPCIHGLGSIADAFESIGERSAEPGAHLWIQKWCDDVAGRGACGHPDGVVRFAGSALHVFAADVARHESGEACARSEGRAWSLPLPALAGAR